MFMMSRPSQSAPHRLIKDFPTSRYNLMGYVTPEGFAQVNVLREASPTTKSHKLPGMYLPGLVACNYYRQLNTNDITAGSESPSAGSKDTLSPDNHCMKRFCKHTAHTVMTLI